MSSTIWAGWRVWGRGGSGGKGVAEPTFGASKIVITVIVNILVIVIFIVAIIINTIVIIIFITIPHNSGRCLMSSNTEVAGRPQWLVGFEGEPVTKGSSLEDHHRLHYQTIIITSNNVIFFITIETMAISEARLLGKILRSFLLEYNVYLLLVAVGELS